MVNSKIIIILVLAITASAIVFYSSSNLTINDKIDVSNSANQSKTIEDIQISDSVTISTNENFLIDENGKKHYILNATDVPVVGEQ